MSSRREQMERYAAEQQTLAAKEAKHGAKDEKEQRLRVARNKREALLRTKRVKAERERWEAHAHTGFWFRVEMDREDKVPCLQHKHFQRHPVCVAAQTLEEVYQHLGPLLFAQITALDGGAKFPSTPIGTALPCQGGSGHGMRVFVHALKGSEANEYQLTAPGVWVAEAGHGYLDGDVVTVLNPNAAADPRLAADLVPGARHGSFTLRGELAKVHQGLPGQQDSDWVLMLVHPRRFTLEELTSLEQLGGRGRAGESRVRIALQRDVWVDAPVGDSTHCCLCGDQVGRCRRRVRPHMNAHKVVRRADRRAIVGHLARYRPETREQVCAGCYMHNVLERDPAEACLDLREQLFLGDESWEQAAIAAADEEEEEEAGEEAQLQLQLQHAEDWGFDEIFERHFTPSSRHGLPDVRVPPCDRRADKMVADPWAAGRHGLPYFLDREHAAAGTSATEAADLVHYEAHHGSSAIADGHHWHYNL